MVLEPFRISVQISQSNLRFDIGSRTFHEPASADIFRLLGYTMAEGTIKRVTDKGFGFIEDGSGKDMFFHSSALEGVRYDELREGQRVSYNVGEGPKGPRAENVRLV